MARKWRIEKRVSGPYTKYVAIKNGVVMQICDTWDEANSYIEVMQEFERSDA